MSMFHTVLAVLALVHPPAVAPQQGASTGAAAIGGPFVLTSHENKMVLKY